MEAHAVLESFGGGSPVKTNMELRQGPKRKQSYSKHLFSGASC